MYVANNFSPTKLEDFINSFVYKDFRPISDSNIINKADTSPDSANNYVQTLDTYNSDASVRFSPGSGVDKLTSDIGAMNKDDNIWKAGITWNTQSLSGNPLDLFIRDNKFNFFPTTTTINQPKNDEKSYNQNHFPKQKRTSAVNKFHKKIYSNRLLINGTQTINKIHSITNNSSNNRLLKIKSAAIYNSKK